MLISKIFESINWWKLFDAVIGFILRKFITIILNTLIFIGDFLYLYLIDYLQH